jgi:DNA-binding NtrC family response regulator
VLQGLRAESLSDDALVLVPDSEFTGDVRVLETTRNRMAVQAAVKDVLGRAVSVTVREKPGPAAGPAEGEAPPADAEPDAAPPAAPPPAAGTPKKKRTTREWAEEPAVRKVMEMFSGSIVDVKE